MLQTMKNRLVHLSLLPAVWAATALPVFAAPAGPADVRGALQTNQDALAEAATSSFTGAGVAAASQDFTNALLAIVGAVGIAMTAWGIWKLYKISSEGEQSRDSAVGPIIMIAVGGMMTITAIATAVFPTLILA